MKRDMDLIRKIVLFIEDYPDGSVSGNTIEIAGYTKEQVGYHSYLMVDSGVAEGNPSRNLNSSGPEYSIDHLTSAGHDFADSVRNPHIWDEVREDMRKRGLVSASLDILKNLLDKKLRKHLDAE